MSSKFQAISTKLTHESNHNFRPKVCVLGSREQLCINEEVQRQESNHVKVSKLNICLFISFNQLSAADVASHIDWGSVLLIFKDPLGQLHKVVVLALGMKM